MIAVHSPFHLRHHPPKEIISNQVIAYGESPERAELVLEALMDLPEIELKRDEPFDGEHFRKVHAPDYLDYLENAYKEWIDAGLWEEGILPEFFAIGSMRNRVPTESPLGKAGYYMTDSCSMIVEGTWDAVRHSGYTALTAAGYLLKGEKSVFALCRPPGHHAGYDFSGGYCFVNNAALAARFLQDKGSAEAHGKTKVAILDIDFHHGNGTQDIIQRQANIFFVSIHGDPKRSYPYLTGYESENSGQNVNFPLPEGVSDEGYMEVFKKAVGLISGFGAEYLVVSLGVDTFEKDHLGDFRLSSAIYPRLAQYLLDELPVPTLIVMEGGYNTEFLASNVVSFLKPFAGIQNL
jgi:acetoin utilization deacetylase AcuC-like enzyme